MGCPTEETLQAFVEGNLAPDALALVAEHLDACSTCRACVAAAAPSSVERVGRYLLTKPLGAGAMGIVYAGYDPDLGRTVAIKLLNAQMASEAQARLLSEAQSLAKLSHPNVVSVYDVGREGEQTFVVMDLISGSSLRAWLNAQKRNTFEIVECFAQAAAGLDAAHRVGLVHRDFKPENVLVTEDGRVLVTDFGLALDQARPASVALNEGSPAYMAPEQAEGVAADARSDQFSFFVALAEALRGRRLPRWLRSATTKGLSPAPADRHASLEHVRALLASARHRQWRNYAGAAAGAVLLAVLLVGAARVAREHSIQVTCEASVESTTALFREEEAKQLERAFLATHSPLASHGLALARERLTDHARRLRESKLETCRELQHQPMQRPWLSAQARCLDERGQGLTAVRDALNAVDVQMLEHLPAILETLGSIETCADWKQLTLEEPELLEPALRADARHAFERGRVALAAGKYPQALLAAEALVTEGRGEERLGLLASALLLRGTAHGRLGQLGEAEADLEECATTASAVGARQVEVEAWVRLVQFIGYEGRRAQDGYRFDRYARAALVRTPGSARLEAERLAWRGALLTRDARFSEALEAAQSELAVVEARLGLKHPLRTVALDTLSGALVGMRRYADAERIQEQACDALKAEVGTLHPRYAACLNNLGSVSAALGKWERAASLRREALAILDVVPGAPSQRAAIERNLARALEAAAQQP